MGGGRREGNGREEEGGKGYKRVNVMQILYAMYVSGKVIPVETVLGIGVGGVKENDGGGKFK
jgi:hypothetical protein